MDADLTPITDDALNALSALSPGQARYVLSAEQLRRSPNPDEAPAGPRGGPASGLGAAVDLTALTDDLLAALSTMAPGELRHSLRDEYARRQAPPTP